MQSNDQQNTKDHLYLKADSHLGEEKPVTTDILNKSKY